MWQSAEMHIEDKVKLVPALLRRQTHGQKVFVCVDALIKKTTGSLDTRPLHVVTPVAEVEVGLFIVMLMADALRKHATPVRPRPLVNLWHSRSP